MNTQFRQWSGALGAPAVVARVLHILTLASVIAIAIGGTATLASAAVTVTVQQRQLRIIGSNDVDIIVVRLVAGDATKIEVANQAGTTVPLADFDTIVVEG